MDSKEWYESKTIIGGLVVVGASLAKLAGFDLELSVDLRAEIVTCLIGLAAILNRFSTFKSVGKNFSIGKDVKDA